jgi:PAS domain S-box-containing protein
MNTIASAGVPPGPSDPLDDYLRPAGLELDLLREAVENIPEAFVTIDGRHTVVYFNAAAEKLFGYPRAEVLGRDLNLILTPECSHDHRRAVGRYLETGAGRTMDHALELVITRRDGTRVPVSISFSVTRRDERVFFTGIIRDMTEAREVRERLARVESLASLGRFTAEVSHEIRNPLMIIGINIHQLRSRVTEGEAATQLGLVEAEVRRLEGFLTELAEYYRPHASEPVVRDVCALVRPECRRREIALECRLEPGAVMVRGDRNGLKEVLINLVQNAVEAVDRGGRLTLESRIGDDLEIRVEDSGPGIPADLREKVFTPFFTTKSRGAGLGLSIAKRIIDGHPGARLEVESGPGGGAVFVVCLPIEAREGSR